MKRNGVLGVLLVCAAAAAGFLSCSKSPEAAGTTPSRPPAPAGSPVSSSSSTVGALPAAIANPNATMESVEPVDLEVGKTLKADGHVAESATTFRPSDAIHVVLVSKGTVSGATIRAVVSFQNGATLFDTSRVVDLKGPGTTTAFEATSATGWPVGRCQLRILIGGKSYRTWDFLVK